MATSKIDQPVKQRLVGALVLLVLAAAFVFLFLQTGGFPTDRRSEINIPLEPVVIIQHTGQTGKRKTLADGLKEKIKQARDATSELSQTESEEIDSSTPVPEAQATEVVITKAVAISEKLKKTPVTQPTPLANAWTIQVGSYRENKNAHKQLNRLEKGGYDTYIRKTIPKGKQPIYRVFVGPEIRRNDAITTKQLLTAKYGMKDLMIKRYSP